MNLHWPSLTPAVTGASTAIAWVAGLFVPNEKPMALVRGAWILVSSLARRAFTKGTTMDLTINPAQLPNLGPTITKAFDWIKANPWVTTEAVDDAKIGFALLTGDKAALAPEVAKAINDVPQIPSNWKPLLTSEPVVNAIVDLLTGNAKAVLDDAKAALTTPSAPEATSEENPSQPAA